MFSSRVSGATALALDNAKANNKKFGDKAYIMWFTKFLVTQNVVARFVVNHRYRKLSLQLKTYLHKARTDLLMSSSLKKKYSLLAVSNFC